MILIAVIWVINSLFLLFVSDSELGFYASMIIANIWLAADRLRHDIKALTLKSLVVDVDNMKRVEQ